MSNDPTADNTPLKQDDVPLSKAQIAVPKTLSVTDAPELLSTLTQAPRGEPLAHERNQEPIRNIDL